MLQKLIRKIANDRGVSAQTNGFINRPPLLYLQEHWENYERLTDIALRLNFKIYPEHRTACSDGSFAPPHVPVLDGLGPIGDNVHTADEFMRADSLTIRPLIISELITSLFFK